MLWSWEGRCPCRRCLWAGTTLGMCGHSTSLHFHNRAERWEAERCGDCFVVQLHCLHQLRRSCKMEKQKSQLSTKVKHPNPKQFSGCPGDALLGVSGENLCKGRVRSRSDKAGSSWKLAPRRGCFNRKHADTREKVWATDNNLLQTMQDPNSTNSLTGRNLSHTTLPLFQLHCVFVSLFCFVFFSFFFLFFSFSCLQFASSGLFTIWLLWFLI